jgi:hypothetical protein
VFRKTCIVRANAPARPQCVDNNEPTCKLTDNDRPTDRRASNANVTACAPLRRRVTEDDDDDAGPTDGQCLRSAFRTPLGGVGIYRTPIGHRYRGFRLDRIVVQSGPNETRGATRARTRRGGALSGRAPSISPEVGRKSTTEPNVQ